MNNKKAPNEQIAFKLFNVKLLDENKFNVLRQLIAEQNDEILELFKLYMNLGNDLKKLSIQINNTFTFLFKKILMKAPTYIGVISLVYIVLIIICQSPYFIDNYYDEIYKKDDKSTHLNVYDLSKGCDKDLNIIRSFVTLLFAYTSLNAVFTIIEAVKERTKKKIDKIFYISLIIDCIIYILIGILGYLTQPIDTPDLIIERKSVFKKDYFMIIGRILLTLTVLGKIAPVYNSARTIFLSSIGIDINNYSTLLNCAITIPLILLSTLVGVLYQKIGDYIDFLGSFSSFFLFCYSWFYVY